MRAALLVLFTASLGVALLSTLPHATAQAPDPGVSFRLAVDTEGDGTNECSTDGGSTTCLLRRDTLFDVDVFLHLLPPELPSYAAFEFMLTGNGGVVSYGRSLSPPDDDWICIVEARELQPGDPLGFGCELIELDQGSTYTGPLGTGIFRCTGDGTVLQQEGELTDPAGQSYLLPDTSLSIRCLPPGDANCNGIANALDATLILQYTARLMPMLPCQAIANTNADGVVNAIDALLVLQHGADILPLPPP